MPEKYLRVKMPDGSKWDVPARVIAEDRAKYYAEFVSKRDELDYDTVYKEEFEFTMDDKYELKDYAADNMDWSDVAEHAVKAEEEPGEVDYQEGWVNGEKEIILK